MTGRISGWTAVCAGVLCGCTAVVDGNFVGKSKPTAAGTGGSATTGGVAGGAGASMVETAACPPPVARRLVQLTELQYVSSLRALLGSNAVKQDGAPQAETKPFTSLGVVPTTASLNTQLNWSEQAVATLLGQELTASGCEADPSDACAQKFLKDFAAKAFRRPALDAEVADLMQVFQGAKAGGDFAGALRLAVQAALSAPSFAYRTELGKDDGQGHFVLTPHELAQELSYFLSDAPPDAELRAAADSGQLSEPAELEKQLSRLLELPAVRRSLTATMLAAWRVSNLFGSSKDPTAFPQFNPQLAASMYQETRRFVDDVLWQRAAPISELLTSRETFVDASLASLYGVPYTGGADGAFVKVTLPAAQRSGLLTQASLMSALSRTDQTSVVARGLFVRGALLCLPKVPQPPANLAPAIEAQLKADMTEKERAEYRATTDPCRNCHRNFDPFGLLLEAYDPIGRYRTEIKGVPVDASMDLSGLGSFQGSIAGAAQMAEVAATSPEFSACIARNLAAYATSDDALTTSACQLQKLTAELPEGSPTFSQVVTAVAKSGLLSLRAQEGAK
jgi:hypothetical protein